MRTLFFMPIMATIGILLCLGVWYLNVWEHERYEQTVKQECSGKTNCLVTVQWITPPIMAIAFVVYALAVLSHLGYGERQSNRSEK